VHDWSQCGVLFEADGRNFESDQTFPVAMKFRLSEVVTEIPVNARVVRTSTKQVALEFTDVNKKIEKAFAKVIEDSMAQTQNEDEQLG
jgi:hypothetical protein